MRLPSPSHPAVLKNTWQIGHRKFNVKKVPVFRVENKNVVSANYRPVSLASTAAKSLERLIKERFVGRASMLLRRTPASVTVGSLN